MRKIVWIGLISLVVFLAGCGENGDSGTSGSGGRRGKEAVRTSESPQGGPRNPHQKLHRVELSLEGYPSAENVGVLLADRLGYFADAGFNVLVFRPVDPDNVPGYVAKEYDEFGLLRQPDLVRSREQGRPLVAIGSLVRAPTTDLIWPGASNVGDLSDLKGKTVGIKGLPTEEGFVRIIAERSGLKSGELYVRTVNYNLVKALAEGRVDAILGSSNSEGVELEAEGVEPVVTPLREFGIPPYEELVMATRVSRLAGNARLIRRFMSAVSRGTAAAIEDPSAAVAVIRAFREEMALPTKAPSVTKAEVEATLPLLAKDPRMSHRRARRLAQWMQGEGLIQLTVPPAALLTNRYVRPAP